MGLFDNLPQWAIYAGAAAIGLLLFYLAWKYLFNKKKDKHHHHREDRGNEEESDQSSSSGKSSEAPKSLQIKIVLLKSQTCGHCRNFAPVWEDLKAKLAGVCQFEEYEASEHPDVMKAYNAESIPKIFLHIGPQPPFEFTGKRTVEDITKFLSEKLKEVGITKN